MTTYFFLATLFNLMLYLLSWITFYVSIPRDKVVILKEDITIGMSFGYIGCFFFGWGTIISLTLTIASFIKTLL